jgi:hypothetical protein
LPDSSYFFSPYCFKISAAVCAFPAPDPALFSLVVLVFPTENPRLIVLAIPPNPLPLPPPVPRPTPSPELFEALAIPSGEPFNPVLIPSADPPLPLSILLLEAVKELPEGGRPIVIPWDPGENLPVPDPSDDVIAIAGEDLPPGPPIGIPREWVEWDEATEAGLPTEEGAKRGVSRDVGDRVEREDER